jgi:hypothetical protein
MGGTGGDFLKNICLEQIGSTPQSQAHLTESGHVIFKDLYFKSLCTLNRNNTTDQTPLELDYSRTNVIENSHYYLDWFSNLTNKIYYIDYPDQCAIELIKIYNQKERNGSLTRFVADHRATLPPWAQPKLNEDNALQIFSVRWLRQLDIWRKNPLLTPISIKDFFIQQKCQQIVETLVDRPLTNIEKFNSMYSNWIKYNTTLRNLIC